jgi:hypothetical protein
MPPKGTGLGIKRPREMVLKPQEISILAPLMEPNGDLIDEEDVSEELLEEISAHVEREDVEGYITNPQKKGKKKRFEQLISMDGLKAYIRSRRKRLKEEARKLEAQKRGGKRGKGLKTLKREQEDANAARERDLTRNELVHRPTAIIEIDPETRKRRNKRDISQLNWGNRKQAWELVKSARLRIAKTGKDACEKLDKFCEVYPSSDHSTNYHPIPVLSNPDEVKEVEHEVRSAVNNLVVLAKKWRSMVPRFCERALFYGFLFRSESGHRFTLTSEPQLDLVEGGGMRVVHEMEKIAEAFASGTRSSTQARSLQEVSHHPMEDTPSTFEPTQTVTTSIPSIDEDDL